VPRANLVCVRDSSSASYKSALRFGARENQALARGKLRYDEPAVGWLIEKAKTPRPDRGKGLWACCGFAVIAGGFGFGRAGTPKAGGGWARISWPSKN